MWLETGMRFFGEGFSQMSDIMLTLRFSGLWPDHISGQVDPMSEIYVTFCHPQTQLSHGSRARYSIIFSAALSAALYDFLLSS